MMYQLGEGVKANLVTGYAWFALAAKNGNADADGKCTQLEEQLSEEDVLKGKTRLSELVERYGM